MSKDNKFGEEPGGTDKDRREDESADDGTPESEAEPEPEPPGNQLRNEHGETGVVLVNSIERKDTASRHARNVAIQVNANSVQLESSAPDQNSPAAQDDQGREDVTERQFNNEGRSVFDAANLVPGIPSSFDEEGNTRFDEESEDMSELVTSIDSGVVPHGI